MPAGQLHVVVSFHSNVDESQIIPLFLFHTCIGSGPEPPFLKPEPANLGAEAWWPLADFATSRGRGSGAAVVVAVADMTGEVRTLLYFRRFDLPLSPFTFALGVGGVPALARKFLVTETALKVAGFLMELERA